MGVMLKLGVTVGCSGINQCGPLQASTLMLGVVAPLMFIILDFRRDVTSLHVVVPVHPVLMLPVWLSA